MLTVFIIELAIVVLVALARASELSICGRSVPCD